MGISPVLLRLNGYGCYDYDERLNLHLRQFLSVSTRGLNSFQAPFLIPRPTPIFSTPSLSPTVALYVKVEFICKNFGCLLLAAHWLA